MRYNPDHAGLSAYLRSDPDLRAELRRRAELGLSYARAAAPRLATPRRDRVRGALAASGHIEDDGTGGVRNDRMQYSIVFDVEYAAAVTFDHRRSQEITRAYLTAAKAIVERG